MTAPAPRSAPRAFLMLAAAAVVALVMTSCEPSSGDAPAASPSPTTSPVALEPTLRDSAPDGFFVGVSVGGGGHLGAHSPEDDPAIAQLVTTQFSSVTPENAAKWEVVQPAQGTYDFTALDAIVDAAQAAGQRVRGHNLLWHQQNPAWLTSGTFTPDELRTILHDHITTVVGRYAGRIAEWDVANEIFDDSGVLRSENPWIAALGPGIVADAFRWAHEADPAAKLFLNDYNLEQSGAKVDAYVKLAQQLLAEGVPVGGIGIQGHLATQYGGPSGLQSVIQKFADLGLDVEITELDVRLTNTAPVDLLEQGQYYAQVVKACLAVARCTGITVWGVSDKDSWVPTTFPQEGSALLFDEALHPKPSFEAFRDALSAGRQ